MYNWESIIAEKMRPTLCCAIEDPVERNKQEYMHKYNRREEVKARNREREKSPERKAYKRAWSKTEKARALWARRGKKYAESHKTILRAKARRYYNAHKDDPKFREKKRAYDRQWKAEHIEQVRAYRKKMKQQRTEYMREWKLRKRLPAGSLYCVAKQITIQDGGTFTVHILKAA